MATVLIHPDIPESRPARPLTIHVIADKFRDIVTISDPNQRFYKPIFTIIISIINILLLIVAFIYNGGINLTTLTLIRMGGQFVPCMKPAATKIRLMDVVCTRGEGKEWPLYDKCTYDQFLKYRCYSFLYPYQLYRFLTAMFLHANMLHLILNVLNIMIVGFSLETKYGTVKISLVYILSGLTGGLLSAVFQRQSSKNLYFNESYLRVLFPHFELSVKIL
ncbi:unnamed protein product [Didymodactylos carnosus]|uniref:rhomboid protease n=1 Tax=Didymodactylos carnosus TaxID=1234261 RepID=A0A8S2E758_9BILA|nr:unnamed protein product [Didymodactylos carnosus]CAF3849373.1 unnamed protein product [Didymodactylos carnosus]